MTRTFKSLFFLSLIFITARAFAETIDITQGNVDPTPIAINEFAGHNHADIQSGEKIIKVIKDDLQNSGLFRAISPAAFIENKVGVNHKPLFAAWQQINANLLVNGEIERLENGKLKIKFILWDTILETKLASETFELSEKIWRRAAHKIADRIYNKVTGYDGYFDSRIVYVSERGPYLKRIKRIAIMDQDGENHQYLTDGSTLVLTPRFSPDGTKILYLSYKNRIPQVFLLNLANGKSSLLGHFPGMSFAPHFSPDGKNALVSIAKHGQTHIYEIDLKSRNKKRLTSGSAIFTSPSYSPDGKNIIFQSDMEGGLRRLYIMNRDGSGIRRINYSTRSAAEPAWSSNNYIAFTTISREFGFTIAVTKPNATEEDNHERLITSGYLVESPCWAPNGRVIAFAKGVKPRGNQSAGLSRIYTIDFTGHNERLLPTPHDASDPNWSKLRL
jgi:TolB protein